jgi:hypothetical protein
LARAAKAREGRVASPGSFSAFAQKPFGKDQVLLTRALEAVSELRIQKEKSRTELDADDARYAGQFSADDLILLNNGLQKILGAYLQKKLASIKVAEAAKSKAAPPAKTKPRDAELLRAERQRLVI